MFLRMIQSEYESGGLNPELMEASPIYRAVLDTARTVDSFGVDPTVAITTLALAPVALRVLRMFNEVLTSAVENHNENQKFERQKKQDAYADQRQMKADKREIWLAKQNAALPVRPKPRPRPKPAPAPADADAHPYADDYASDEEFEDDIDDPSQ